MKSEELEGRRHEQSALLDLVVVHLVRDAWGAAFKAATWPAGAMEATHQPSKPEFFTPEAQSPTSRLISNLSPGRQYGGPPRITNPGQSRITASMPQIQGMQHYQCDPGGIVTPASHNYNTVAATSSAAPPHHQIAPSGSVFSPNMSPPQMGNYGRRSTDASIAILSAERYDDGGSAARRVGRSERGGQLQQQSPVLAFGISLEGQEQEQEQEQPRGVLGQRQTSQRHDTGSKERPATDKRRRKHKLGDDEDDDDDPSKKARGRPRLDTKDETAADRRRTQIRMAQRAYRHRKETTIASLEKQVQELRGTNEEMSNIFLNLHDFAMQRGILDREREFGSHLASSTQRFIALAKSSASDDSAREDESYSLEGEKQTRSPEPESNGKSHKTVPVPATLPDVSSSTEPYQAQMWGYQIMKNEEGQSQRSQIDLQDLDLESFMQMPSQAGQHQIISRPTPFNASFSYDTGNDFFQQFNAEIPDAFESYARNVAFQETLPLAKTLSQHETTFGRHLSRAALEKGLSLILDKNANPLHIQMTFGFCLRFETPEQIVTRLKASLATNSKDPLFNWKAPFVHLGGAGTYYPLDENISGTMMPKFRTGMSMGPFSTAVADTRENAMVDEFQTSHSGFQGAWFDPNDVENYLRGCGIEIPLNAEFVTVDLDLLSQKRRSSSISFSDGTFSNSYSPPQTPPTDQNRYPQVLTRNSSVSENYLASTDVAIAAQGAEDQFMEFATSFDDWSNAVAPTHMQKSDMSVVNLAGPVFDSVHNSVINNGDAPFRKKRLVTISVTVLVEELLARVVCLGRSAGFRPAEVDSAIQRTLSKAF